MRCVHGKYCSSLDVGSSLLPRYEDALVLLLTEVLNRIQFRYNQAQLEELDDETLDDDVRGISLLLIYLTSLLLKKKNVLQAFYIYRLGIQRDQVCMGNALRSTDCLPSWGLVGIVQGVFK